MNLRMELISSLTPKFVAFAKSIAAYKHLLSSLLGRSCSLVLLQLYKIKVNTSVLSNFENVNKRAPPYWYFVCSCYASKFELGRTSLFSKRYSGKQGSNVKQLWIRDFYKNINYKFFFQTPLIAKILNCLKICYFPSFCVFNASSPLL